MGDTRTVTLEDRKKRVVKGLDSLLYHGERAVELKTLIIGAPANERGQLLEIVVGALSDNDGIMNTRFTRSGKAMLLLSELAVRTNENFMLFSEHLLRGSNGVKVDLETVKRDVDETAALASRMYAQRLSSAGESEKKELLSALSFAARRRAEDATTEANAATLISNAFPPGSS